MKVYKTETVEQFLARGGKITKITPTESTENQLKKPLNTGPVKILSMEEADLFHGEKKTRKTKSKEKGINISALPESLKEKLIARIAEEDEEQKE